MIICVILSPLTRLSTTFFYNYFVFYLIVNYRWIYPKEINRNSSKKLHKVKLKARVKSVFLEILANPTRSYAGFTVSVFFRERCKGTRINLRRGIAQSIREIPNPAISNVHAYASQICAWHMREMPRVHLLRSTKRGISPTMRWSTIGTRELITFSRLSEGISHEFPGLEALNSADLRPR